MREIVVVDDDGEQDFVNRTNPSWILLFDYDHLLMFETMEAPD